MHTRSRPLEYLAMTETTLSNPVRIGAVDYLNTLPLIDGLDKLANLDVIRDVPSHLIDRLLSDDVDLALCSIIDYQRSDVPLKIVPAGLLGSHGSTMTVRLFSRVPMERVSEIHCDTDSHTSVCLLRILLHRMHGIKPTLVDFDARNHGPGDVRGRRFWPEAMLLIGDKVVTDYTPAIRYPYQIDLGAEWRELTGLPFVFATWLAKAEHDVAAIGAVLDRQLRHNLRDRIESILKDSGASRGWPPDLARVYLTEMLMFQWTDETRESVDRFFDDSFELGLIDHRHPLRFESIG